MFEKMKAKAQSHKEEEQRQAEDRRGAEQAIADERKGNPDRDSNAAWRFESACNALEDRVEMISSEVNQFRLDRLLKG